MSLMIEGVTNVGELVELVKQGKATNGAKKENQLPTTAATAAIERYKAQQLTSLDACVDWVSKALNDLEDEMKQAGVTEEEAPAQEKKADLA